jgi:hypothetical protein
MKKLKLKLRRSNAVLKEEKDLVSYIIDDIKEQLEHVDLETMKYNTQFINDIMTCIESSVNNKKGKKKIDKKNVVLSVFTELFPNIDLEQIEDKIKYVHENDMMTANSMAVKVLFGFFNFFLGK